MPASNARRWEPSIASEGIHDTDVIELRGASRQLSGRRRAECAGAGRDSRHAFGVAYRCRTRPGGLDTYAGAMSHDALVVGSGPNGLTAAITLARAGRRVLVLEAAPRAGGAVATEELTLPGFRHDTFSAVYPAGAASPVFAAMELERHGLRWIHPPVCLAHPLPDGSAVALYRDLDRTAASLDATHSGDGERWRVFAAPFVDSLRRAARHDARRLSARARAAATDRGHGPAGDARFLAAAADGRAASLGEELFTGEGTRAWLYGSAMHSDVPPVSRGSAIAAAYLSLLGHGAGWPSPEGGAGRLADALLACLRELGGEVRTGAKVVRMVVERGRVVGVELLEASGSPRRW